MSCFANASSWLPILNEQREPGQTRGCLTDTVNDLRATYPLLWVLLDKAAVAQQAARLSVQPYELAVVLKDTYVKVYVPSQAGKAWVGGMHVLDEAWLARLRSAAERVVVGRKAAVRSDMWAKERARSEVPPRTGNVNPRGPFADRAVITVRPPSFV
jgi:hypothetical protein